MASFCRALKSLMRFRRDSMSSQALVQFQTLNDPSCQCNKVEQGALEGDPAWR